MLRVTVAAAPTLAACCLVAAASATTSTQAAAALSTPFLHPLPTLPSLPIPTPSCTLIPLPPLCPTPTVSIPPTPPPSTPPIPTPSPPIPTPKPNPSPTPGDLPPPPSPGTSPQPTSMPGPSPGGGPLPQSLPLLANRPPTAGGPPKRLPGEPAHAGAQPSAAAGGSSGPLGPSGDGSTPPGPGTDAGGSNTTIELPAITDVATPDQLVLTPALLGESLVFAVLLLGLLLGTCVLVNATWHEHASAVHAFAGDRARAFTQVSRAVARVPRAIAIGTFLLAGAALYALLDQALGLTLTTAAELIALLGALLVVTLVHDVLRGWIVARRRKQPFGLTVNTAGLLIAVALVTVSRALQLQPGLIFGAMTAAVFTKQLPERVDGRSRAGALCLLLAVSFAAWFGWMPVKAAVATAQNPGFGLITLDTLLATTWVVGVQSTMFAALPLPFMDGGKLSAWSRAGAVVIQVFALFVFVVAIMPPTTERFGQRPSLVTLVALLCAVTVVAGGARLYSSMRHRRVGAAG